jgi:putative transposase
MVEHSSPHRKRVRRYNDPGHAHFLTFSCYRRLPLLSKDRTRQWTVDAIAVARVKHEFDLWAWVIMPEHIHLLFYPRPQLYKVQSIEWSIKQPVGAKAMRWLKQHAPAYIERLTVHNRNRTYRRFWQAGPGVDENIEEPAALQGIIDYIHNNPVQRGLVNRPEDWPWSSARDWLGLPDCPLLIDRTLPMTVETPWKASRT